MLCSGCLCRGSESHAHPRWDCILQTSLFIAVHSPQLRQGRGLQAQQQPQMQDAQQLPAPRYRRGVTMALASRGPMCTISPFYSSRLVLLGQDRTPTPLKLGGFLEPLDVLGWQDQKCTNSWMPVSVVTRNKFMFWNLGRLLNT